MLHKLHASLCQCPSFHSCTCLSCLHCLHHGYFWCYHREHVWWRVRLDAALTNKIPSLTCYPVNFLCVCSGEEMKVDREKILRALLMTEL